MSLLCDILSSFVIAFLPRSKRLLISWLQSLSAMIFEPPKIKSDTVSTVSPSISHEVMGPDAMILGSTVANKANGGDRIPAELFKFLNDDAISAAFNMSANLENPNDTDYIK